MSTEKELRKRLVLAVAGVLFLLVLVVVLNMEVASAAFVDDGTTAQILYDCGIVNTTNAVYTMNQSVFSLAGCLGVMATNITIDCQGNTITYGQNGSCGINSTNFDYITVKNCKVFRSAVTGRQAPEHAIYYSGSSNGTIVNNTIRTARQDSYGVYLTLGSNNNNVSNNNITTTNGDSYGVYFYQSSNNTLNNNKIATTAPSAIDNTGIRLYQSSDNTINNNSVSTTYGQGIYLNSISNNNNLNNNSITVPGSGYFGIYLNSSSFNTLLDNKVNSTQSVSYMLDGTDISHYNNSIDISNLAEGLPVNYTYNVDNLAFDYVDFEQYGQVIFAWCENITITNSNFSSDSLTLFYTNTSTILNNNINASNGCWGISFSSISDNNQINNNVIVTSAAYNCHGIYLRSTSNSVLNNNIIKTKGSISYGMYIISSSNSTINNNTITTEGSSSNGIYLPSSSNSTINNNIIVAPYAYGIYLSPDNSQIDNNIITGSGGIGFSSSSTSTINNNIIATSTGPGIYLQSGSNSTINNNTITTSGQGGYGIYLYSSPNSNLTNNRVNTSHTNSYVIYGVTSDHFNNSIDGSNLAEGLPVNYTYDTDNLVFNDVDFSSQYGQVIFGWCNNITIRNSNFSSDSLNLFNTKNSTISNNFINTSMGYGIWLYESSNLNTISNNTITSTEDGIRLYSSSNSNNISNNTITSSAYGIYLYSGPLFNIISNNTIKSTDDGIQLNFGSSSNNLLNNAINSSSYGIYLYYSSNLNTISNNTIKSIDDGIQLYSSSNFNNISNNAINSSSDGIFLSSTSNSNNILNNAINSSAYGIYLSGSSNNYNINNIINGRGLIVSGSSNNYNINNTITTNGSSAYGIYLSGSSNNYNINNTITTNGSSAYGIYSDAGSNSNNNLNNIITTKSYGIYLIGTSDSTIVNNIINSGDSGIYFNYYSTTITYFPIRNTLNNNTITTSGNNHHGIYLILNSSSNNINNNTITTSGNRSYGIFSDSAINNKMGNNLITTSGNFSSGIYFEGDFTYYNATWNNTNPSFNNTLNKNTIITSGPNGYGIFLNSYSYYNQIINTTITTSGVNAYGIIINSTSSNTLTGNQVNTSQTNSYVLYGIVSPYYNNSIDNSNLAEGLPVNYTYNTDNLIFDYVDFEQYGQVIFAWCRNITIKNSNFSSDSLTLFYTNTSTILNNNINSSTGYGLWLYSSSNNNNINNTITTSGVNGYGIYLDSNTNNNAFSGMSIITNDTGAYSIYIAAGSHNFTITDSILNSSRTQDFVIVTNVAGGMWNFTNVTRANGTPITINWSTGSVGTLNMHWYLDVNVTSGGAGLQNANVTSYNNKSRLVFSQLTGSDGRTRKALLEYTRNATSGTSYTRYSPYNLSVTLAGYPSYYNSSINISNNVFMDIELGCGCPVGSDWIVSLNCTMIDSICNMPSYKVICTSGSLTMTNYTLIADKVITPIGHGCLIMDNRSRVMIGS